MHWKTSSKVDGAGWNHRNPKQLAEARLLYKNIDKHMGWHWKIKMYSSIHFPADMEKVSLWCKILQTIHFKSLHMAVRDQHITLCMSPNFQHSSIHVPRAGKPITLISSYWISILNLSCCKLMNLYCKSIHPHWPCSLSPQPPNQTSFLSAQSFKASRSSILIAHQAPPPLV